MSAPFDSSMGARGIQTEHGFGEGVDFAGVHEGGEGGLEVEGVGLLDGGGVGVILVHHGALVEGGGDVEAEVFEGGG